MSEQYFAAITEDLTRRQWILRLGKTATLAGFSGLVPELITGFLRAEQEESDLPPGLYLPSGKNLVHAMRGIDEAFAASPGSETDYAPLVRFPFQPRFFSNDEFRMVTRLVELILGKVDAAALSQTTQWLDLWFHAAAGVREAAQNLDPLQRVLAVAFYGEEPVRALETCDPQAVARAGLTALVRLSVDSYGQEFLGLSVSKQMELIGSIERSNGSGPLPRFFEIMRGEAIRGYYTTAEGIGELDYKGNIYYPYCPGCEAAGDAAFLNSRHQR